MTTFSQGYDNKHLTIRVHSRDDGKAELWIERFDGFKYDTYGVEGDDRNDDRFRTETLAYAALDELVRLRNEINQTIKTSIFDEELRQKRAEAIEKELEDRIKKADKARIYDMYAAADPDIAKLVDELNQMREEK